MIMVMKPFINFCVLAVWAAGFDGWAALRLPALFSDNLVLQQKQQVPIWGWSDPGQKVTVTFAGQTKTAQAGADGRWQVKLDPLAASATPADLVVTGASNEDAVTIRNVLVGEVWLCTGPSNIFWPVSKCDNAKAEMAGANFLALRFFTVARKPADEPQAECQGSWIVCDPKTVGAVSGAGYFFARELHQQLGVPVALLQSFWGGSRVESWTSREALQAEPALKPVLAYWEDRLAKYDPGKAEAANRRAQEEWQKAADDAKVKGQKAPRKPKLENDPRQEVHRPACLFNGMIAPLIPYGIRGAITYQGLGNLFWAEHSYPLLKVQAADWRKRWGQGDFPIGMIQPAPYTCENWAQSGPDAYSIQREAQIRALQTLNNIGVALTMDINDVKALHFTGKQPVGHRLAAWAFSTVYGRPSAWRGPLFQSFVMEENKARVHFSHATGGLKTTDGKAPAHFEIAGADHVFHPAGATIEGETVVLHHPAVARPAAIRYAWGKTDVSNLVNQEGLPASLFQSTSAAP